MGWDLQKCLWGTPANFSDAAAQQAVAFGAFAASVYVNVSAQSQNTKQAYTYYLFGGYRICVVGHVHRDATGGWTQPGNCYIPGWLGNLGTGWQMQTPAAQIAVIGALAQGGQFPGNDRYPHPQP